MTTVLVVEDEILVRLAICDDLAAEGYEVLTADNAGQAIEILESRNDIISIYSLSSSSYTLRTQAVFRQLKNRLHLMGFS